jgi:ferrochelatase
MMTHNKKTAIVLFNLGAPTDMQSVRPFLFNLFNDPAIIRLPNPFRFLLAKLLSKQRLKEAEEIYAALGGGSPLLKNTQDQADVLQEVLGVNTKVFVVMRYWYPRASFVMDEVAQYEPDKIVLLPLYPQFSTTTTASSFKEWYRELPPQLKGVETIEIKDYPENVGFIEAIVSLIQERVRPVDFQKSRVLFSAHGLPERIVRAGDPYQSQVETTVARIVQRLGVQGLDYEICYQSRVGPLKWIGPSAEDAIERAARNQKEIIFVPVSFVSEHSETLYENDIQYKKMADNLGIEKFTRVPCVSTHPLFIEGLKDLVSGDTYSKEIKEKVA